MSEKTVVVVAGGARVARDAAHSLASAAAVIAADGGLDNALALGLEATTVIGDFDSVSAAAIEAAERSGARIVRHPEAKDATDLELALDAALELSPTRIHVLADAGGRLDHALSALLLLASPKYEGVELDGVVGVARVRVIRGEQELRGTPGRLVSLLPLHGPAVGVTTEGLAYPLTHETLEPGSSRGVSNVFMHSTARVRVAGGVLLAIQPEGAS